MPASVPPVEDRFDYEGALAACARGDRAGLLRLYEQEAARLLGVALRIVRRRDLAEEVLHDAFLKIMQRSSTYSPSKGSGRGWIYTVVRHGAINKLRDSAQELPTDEAWLASIPDDERADPLTQLMQVSESRALHDCLQQLEVSKRRSIQMAFVEGLTHDQIATRLGSPLGTVKAWIRRGLLSLRECLS